MKTVIVSGGFDDLRSRQVRFFEEAAKFGAVHILLWSDDAIRALTNGDPKFPQAERLYLLEAIRYVHQVSLVDGRDVFELHQGAQSLRPDLWVVDAASDTLEKKALCTQWGMEYVVLAGKDLEGFPPYLSTSGEKDGYQPRKKVIVTGCFDWLHSGHVRFFEEASELGYLFVAVGSDANVRMLKGEGHPLFTEDERRYMVQSVRHVKQALITSGSGWMDAAPEIATLRPDIYLVNEDGDHPDKRLFCEEHGLEYVVLKRTPKAGLSRRASTSLRGF